MNQTHITVSPETLTIDVTRVFDASRELVFAVSTEPRHIVRWYVCETMTMPVCDVDLRPGGAFRFVMREADGTEYPFAGHYQEVVRPEKLVYTSVLDIAPLNEHPALATITFAERDGKTEYHSHIVFPNVQSFQAALASGMTEGLPDALNRYEKTVDALAAESDSPEFTISRTLDAPPELVFRAWSESDRLAQWWGPKGCKIRIAAFDFRPGGIFHYAREMPGGHEMWGKFFYSEIDTPDRLVFTNSFSDADAGITRAPFDPDWPLEVRNVITLTEQGGKTKLTLRGSTINATAAEKAAFAAHLASMEQGFGGMFDQLAEYLAGVQSGSAG